MIANAPGHAIPRPSPPPAPRPASRKAWCSTGGSLAAILLHAALRHGIGAGTVGDVPLFAALLLGGGPLLVDLLRKLARRDVGADLLAGIAIVTSVLLGEYLAGTLVVLMLAGGTALESFAVDRASSALHALARRSPSVAHRRDGDRLEDIALDDVAVGDVLVVVPHEICPVDGVVVEGHGPMDESYLTGEPFEIHKTPGATRSGDRRHLRTAGAGCQQGGRGSAGRRGGPRKAESAGPGRPGTPRIQMVELRGAELGGAAIEEQPLGLPARKR